MFLIHLVLLCINSCSYVCAMYICMYSVSLSVLLFYLMNKRAHIHIFSHIGVYNIYVFI